MVNDHTLLSSSYGNGPQAPLCNESHFRFKLGGLSSFRCGYISPTGLFGTIQVMGLKCGFYNEDPCGFSKQHGFSLLAFTSAGSVPILHRVYVDDAA